jgi:hypothetical protein
MSETVSLLPQYALMMCARTLHLYDVATLVSNRAARISGVFRVVVRRNGGVKV